MSVMATIEKPAIAAFYFTCTISKRNPQSQKLFTLIRFASLVSNKCFSVACPSSNWATFGCKWRQLESRMRTGCIVSILFYLPCERGDCRVYQLSENFAHRYSRFFHKISPTPNWWHHLYCAVLEYPGLQTLVNTSLWFSYFLKILVTFFSMSHTHDIKISHFLPSRPSHPQ